MPLKIAQASQALPSPTALQALSMKPSVVAQASKTYTTVEQRKIGKELALILMETSL